MDERTPLVTSVDDIDHTQSEHIHVEDRHHDESKCQDYCWTFISEVIMFAHIAMCGLLVAMIILSERMPEYQQKMNTLCVILIIICVTGTGSCASVNSCMLYWYHIILAVIRAWLFVGVIIVVILGVVDNMSRVLYGIYIACHMVIITIVEPCFLASIDCQLS